MMYQAHDALRGSEWIQLCNMQLVWKLACFSNMTKSKNPGPVGQKRKVGHPEAVHVANPTHVCPFPPERNDRKTKKKERSGFIFFFDLCQPYVTLCTYCKCQASKLWI